MRTIKSFLFLVLILNLVSAFSLSLHQNPFQYSHEYVDEESKLQYLKARYYNPALPRFISRDSYDLSNRYGYVDGNPVMNEDPSGHTLWNALANLFKCCTCSTIEQPIQAAAALPAAEEDIAAKEVEEVAEKSVVSVASAVSRVAVSEVRSLQQTESMYFSKVKIYKTVTISNAGEDGLSAVEITSHQIAADEKFDTIKFESYLNIDNQTQAELAQGNFSSLKQGGFWLENELHMAKETPVYIRLDTPQVNEAYFSTLLQPGTTNIYQFAAAPRTPEPFVRFLQNNEYKPELN